LPLLRGVTVASHERPLPVGGELADELHGKADASGGGQSLNSRGDAERERPMATKRKDHGCLLGRNRWALQPSG